MKFFMRSFGHTQLYSNGIHINECFYEKFWTFFLMGRRFGHTQLYSNGILY